MKPSITPTLRLDGLRWTLLTDGRELWLVLDEGDGPKGVRLARDGRRGPRAFNVGDFIAFLAWDRSTLAVIRDEEFSGFRPDDALFSAWRDAGCPKRKGNP